MHLAVELLKERHSCFRADSYRLFVPNAGLDFADMGAAHHQHTKPGLANTTANGQWQFTVQQHLVERQFPAVIATCQIKDSSSTRIPIEEISKARSKTGSQNKMSQLSCQSS